MIQHYFNFLIMAGSLGAVQTAPTQATGDTVSHRSSIGMAWATAVYVGKALIADLQKGNGSSVRRHPYIAAASVVVGTTGLTLWTAMAVKLHYEAKQAAAKAHLWTGSPWMFWQGPTGVDLAKEYPAYWCACKILDTASKIAHGIVKPFHGIKELLSKKSSVSDEKQPNKVSSPTNPALQEPMNKTLKTTWDRLWNKIPWPSLESKRKAQ